MRDGEMKMKPIHIALGLTFFGATVALADLPRTNSATVSVRPVPDPPMGHGVQDIAPKDVSAYSCKSLFGAIKSNNPDTSLDRLRILFGVDQWIYGYLSAVNDRLPASKRVSPGDLAPQSFGFWLGYCKVHPAAMVSEIVAAWSDQPR